MAGNMEGSYVKASSIHHSYQRAVVTHDTNNWEVRDNVAYDIRGHAYFMEDGTEQYNTLSGNLGIRVKSSSALLKGDTTPAVFWTATPTNFFYSNAAANSDSFGFWFELVGRANRPVGDKDEDPCPATGPIGQFFNNTMHNHNSFGLRIYPLWIPLVNPCDGK